MLRFLLPAIFLGTILLVPQVSGTPLTCVVPSTTGNRSTANLWHENRESMQGLVAVPFQDVEIHDTFWSPRLLINRTVTLEACLAQSKKQGNINNFALVAGKGQGQHSGLVYHDSDLYKVLQGAAY